MNYAGIFKRQTFLVVASVCAIIVVLVGISYALFQKNVQGNDLVIKTGNLVVTFSEGTTITDDLVPMTNAEGLAGAPSYSFTIVNEGSLNAKYDIQVYQDSSATGTIIPHQYVMISLDGADGVALSTIEKVSGETESNYVYKIGSDTIASSSGGTNETKSHTVKVWIKDDAPETVIGNKVALKLNVVSEVQG